MRHAADADRPPAETRERSVTGYPNFGGKWRAQALVEPAAYIAYLCEHGRGPGDPPPLGAVLVYDTSLLRWVKREHRLVRVPGTLGEHLYRLAGDPELMVGGGFGIGAPVAAAILEELVALGCRRVISMGTAGTLQPDLHTGDLVVCERAVRDEGTSHHYLEPSECAEASAALSGRLERELAALGRRCRRGAGWTIDAIYRETRAEALHYKQRGILTVDMEAAALFAVAAYRGVEAAAVFAVSDSLAGLEWLPDFRHPDIRSSLEAMFTAAVRSLRD